jgi:hypothetical protein
MPRERAVLFLRRAALELAFPLGLFLAFGTLCSFFRDVDFLFFFFGVIALFLWLVVQVVRVVAALWKQKWPKAGLIVAGVGSAFLLALPVMMAGDYVHLALMYPFYEDRIVALHSQRVSFNWGADGFVGVGGTDYVLVYDPVGAIQKEGPVLRFPDGSEFPVGVRHLIGSFYLRTIFYP